MDSYIWFWLDQICGVGEEKQTYTELWWKILCWRRVGCRCWPHTGSQPCGGVRSSPVSALPAPRYQPKMSTMYSLSSFSTACSQILIYGRVHCKVCHVEAWYLLQFQHCPLHDTHLITYSSSLYSPPCGGVRSSPVSALPAPRYPPNNIQEFTL